MDYYDNGDAEMPSHHTPVVASRSLSSADVAWNANDDDAGSVPATAEQINRLRVLLQSRFQGRARVPVKVGGDVD
mgnify:CR=1 FL=1